MLTPIFTHGTYANTIKAIEEGKIKYPAYCWCTDVQQYGFLNKEGELETIGIPTLTGTAEKEIILSSLDDGLYEISGQHKITADDETTYYSMSNILCVVQTIDGKKKVKRITADTIEDATVEEDLSVTRETVATKEWIQEQGYADQAYIDYKFEILKQELEDEIEELVLPIVEPVVNYYLDNNIGGIPEEDIEDLFDEEEA